MCGDTHDMHRDTQDMRGDTRDMRGGTRDMRGDTFDAQRVFRTDERKGLVSTDKRG